MQTVYERLAKFLDKLPGGYPATDSGVEIRILKRLFDPEEAELAMALSLLPENPSQIAERLNADASFTADKLNAMSKKGLINRYTKDGKSLYMAANFVIGIWEFQVKRLTKELIDDFNEYIPHVIKQMSGHNTKQVRIIPVAKSVSNEPNVMPYEEAAKIIRAQSKIVATPCICRTEMKISGHGCDAPVNNCLSFGTNAYFYEENGLGKTITQEDALKLLEEAAEAGLVLQPVNAQKTLSICMCCGCCCGILRTIKKMESPGRFMNSRYYSQVAREDCTACGNCVEICPMNAITLDETAFVNAERCIGCGLCVTKCDLAAIRLMQKENAEAPPANIIETFTKISKERGLI